MGLLDRFWAKVSYSDDCWEWQGAIRSWGYGVFQAGSWGHSKVVRAHRMAWEIVNGPIPEGLWVLHRCDNPRCVRPDHLFLGDAFDNMRDCANKGRLGSQVHPEARPRGERHHNARLTDDQVETIRRRYAAGGVSQYALAAEYGTTRPTIGRIVQGRTRRHPAGTASSAIFPAPGTLEPEADSRLQI